jgi:hypothetical protein
MPVVHDQNVFAALIIVVNRLFDGSLLAQGRRRSGERDRSLVDALSSGGAAARRTSESPRRDPRKRPTTRRSEPRRSERTNRLDCLLEVVAGWEISVQRRFPAEKAADALVIAA